MKIGCGLVRQTHGEARVAGHAAGSRNARATVGYLAEHFRFPGWSSAEEVLALYQRLARSGGGPGERTRLLELVGLAEAQRVHVEEMSKGMQQRLGIAQALVGEPRLLLLDEPTSALDPIGRRIVRRLLEDLRGRGIAVLLNSHLLSEVELVCDRVYILSHGQVVAAGTPHELARPRGVEIETAAGREEHSARSHDDIARLVAELVARGEQIHAVRPLGSTLEDAYVRAIGDEPAS
ncbi:MAG: type transport system ATP-binding protein [Thermoleophilaceae bacterium]|nr:type transport system ATP-binding protein [Thermoleophilaceae bacterium]